MSRASALRSKEKKGEPVQPSSLAGVVACACLVGAVAFFVLGRNDRFDGTFSFISTLLNRASWMWNAGGIAISLSGCLFAEEARRRGAARLFASSVFVTCLILLIGHIGVLLYWVVGFGVDSLLDWLRCAVGGPGCDP